MWRAKGTPQGSAGWESGAIDPTARFLPQYNVFVPKSTRSKLLCKGRSTQRNMWIPLVREIASPPMAARNDSLPCIDHLLFAQDRLTQQRLQTTARYEINGSADQGSQFACHPAEGKEAYRCIRLEFKADRYHYLAGNLHEAPIQRAIAGARDGGDRKPRVRFGERLSGSACIVICYGLWFAYSSIIHCHTSPLCAL